MKGMVGEDGEKRGRGRERQRVAPLVTLDGNRRRVELIQSGAAGNFKLFPGS